MLSCCLNCRKNADSKMLKVKMVKNGRIVLSSNCAVCGSKNYPQVFLEECKLCCKRKKKHAWVYYWWYRNFFWWFW